jgi:hypothetical protein
MGKLIDSAVAHFNSKEVRELRVDEWDCTLYSKNLSLAEKSKWLKRADGDGTDYLVYAVIYGVTDEAGESVFDIGDKNKLREHVDPEVLSKVANFVLELSANDESEREKN